jgi:hypothetical protein
VNPVAPHCSLATLRLTCISQTGHFESLFILLFILIQFIRPE